MPRTWRAVFAPLGFDKIALLRLDCDWYRPTALCIKMLSPMMSSGGVLIIDDYFAWEGCRRAVDEAFTAVSEALGGHDHRPPLAPSAPSP